MTFGGTTYGGTAYGSTTAEAAVTASASLTGSATLTADATQHHRADATLSGSATLTADATVGHLASATLSGSATLRADTKFVAGVPSQGWHVVVIHPETGRRITASVLDRDPAILPSLNSLPEVRIPVRKNDAWLDPALADDPPMLAWLDGVRQPIDRLREVEDRPDHTLLVGIGATELRQRVQKEIRSGRRHDEAKSLVTSETTYSEDVDTPTVETLTDQDQFDSSTTAGFDADTDFAADVPLTTAGDEITTTQTCFTTEGENTDSRSGADDFSDARFSGNGPISGDGQALRIDANGESGSWDFTPQHDIPASDLEIQVRIETTDSPELTMSLNSESWVIVSDSQATGLQWNDYGNSSDAVGSGYTGDDLTAGTTYTLKIEATSAGGASPDAFIDVVAPLDRGSRFPDGPFSYTLDNSLTTGSDGGRYLDGPQTHPDIVNAVSIDVESAFSITDGAASITMTDSNTTGNQRLQISNDRGSNWLPTGGAEDNTTSVDETFATTGAAIRMRVTLDRYSPSGTRDQTPREGYAGQGVQSWDLDADIDLELLLTDYKEDQRIVDHLNQFATDQEFVWSANLDVNGDYQVSWTQPGQRTASDDPDIGDFSFTKDLDTWDEINIRGSNKKVNGGTFTASTTFVDTSPAYDDIVSGSETVYDDQGTNYDRNTDYEMDYTAGQIRLVDGGDLTDGNTYNIDFEVEVLGTYPPDVSNPERESVSNVPGVASDKAAEQIAYLLYTEFNTPRYAGTLSVPKADVTFDPLAALSLTNLDLPSEATPLEVRGDPSITPTGLEIRLGNRGRLEAALGDIASQVRAVSKRV